MWNNIAAIVDARRSGKGESDKPGGIRPTKCWQPGMPGFGAVAGLALGLFPGVAAGPWDHKWTRVRTSRLSQRESCPPTLLGNPWLVYRQLSKGSKSHRRSIQVHAQTTPWNPTDLVGAPCSCERTFVGL